MNDTKQPFIGIAVPIEALQDKFVEVAKLGLASKALRAEFEGATTQLLDAWATWSRAQKAFRAADGKHRIAVQEATSLVCDVAAKSPTALDEGQEKALEEIERAVLHISRRQEWEQS